MKKIHYKAEVKPVTYSRQASNVPGCDDKEIIQQRGRYYTILAARLLEPTPDYPTPMVSIRLSSGADSAFCQLRIEEYDNLIRILQGWREKYEVHLVSLRQKEAVYVVAKEQRDKQLAALREFMGGTNEDSNLPPDKIIEMMNAFNKKQAESNV